MSRGTDALQEIRSMLSYYKEFVKCKLPTKAGEIDSECMEELNTIEEELKRLDNKASAFDIIKSHLYRMGGVRGTPDGDNEYVISLRNVSREDYSMLVDFLFFGIDRRQS